MYSALYEKRDIDLEEILKMETPAQEPAQEPAKQ
jgi:hypothetical protein